MELTSRLLDGLPGMVMIGLDNPRFSQHIQLVGLNDQISPAARAALIALVTRHLRIS